MTITTASTRANRRQLKLSPGKILSWVVIGVAILIILFPFWWVVRTSLSTQREMLAQPESLAVFPSVSHQTQTIALTEAQGCAGQFRVHQLDHITTPQIEPVDMYDSNGAGLAINDLDNDGKMDIVLANLRGNNNIFWNEGGLVFRREELTHGSSRAVAIVDVDADGWLDIVFTTRTGKSIIYWHNLGTGKFEQLTLPGVDQYAYSMAWGDVDKDGDLDLVTGSYDTALDKELRDAFMFSSGAGVFYYENQQGIFAGERLAEKSQALAVQLLDVNNDGRLDILIGNDFGTVPDNYWLQTDSGWQAANPVNGMMTASTFSHLPSFELVEENQALRNGGNGQFLPKPNWNLNQTDGGRGMSMADMDNDGDLDIIINNLLSPSVLLENQLCQGNSLLVDLRWPDTQNPYAIGALVTLQTSTGFQMRDVRVNSGYLSGDPSQLHFGFSVDSQPFGLVIVWPDSTISHIFDIEPNQKLVITRGK